MLPLVEIEEKKLKEYEKYVSSESLSEIENLALDLKGVNVDMINSTPRGGGVAEMLKSIVPLMKGLGINVNWHTIPVRENIFEVTKKIHNSLQGKGSGISKKEKDKYLDYLKDISHLTEDMNPDAWIVHDPQPAGLILYQENLHPSILRIHLDLSDPDKDTWEFMLRFLNDYDKIIVSTDEYLKPEIREKSVVFSPGMDPSVSKNIPIEVKRGEEILESFGIKTNKPLVSQIMRFDPSKDPLGSIEAYRKAKEEIPELQLAMVGFFLANDDPEASRVYEKCRKEVKGDKDVFLFANANKLSGLKVDTFVNAAQTVSDVIMQKSLKEGFGLAVTEAMWKEKAVIGGNNSGMRLQIKDGVNGFLVNSSKEAAKRIVEIIKNPELAQKLGREAKETVREEFLITRVLRDYLKVIKEII